MESITGQVSIRYPCTIQGMQVPQLHNVYKVGCYADEIKLGADVGRAAFEGHQAMAVRGAALAQCYCISSFLTFPPLPSSHPQIH